MPSQRDLEGGTTPDERAPLLGPEAVRRDDEAILERDDASEEPSKAASKTWYYVWRGVLILLAILVVAVFIKGWIEADDVDVSKTYHQHHFEINCMPHSLISKAP
jgi:hypothetical protein